MASVCDGRPLFPFTRCLSFLANGGKAYVSSPLFSEPHFLMGAVVLIHFTVKFYVVATLALLLFLVLLVLLPVVDVARSCLRSISLWMLSFRMLA